MTTYTYPADGRGEAISGLSAEDVAHERLTHDGYTYELRREDGAWCLYVSQGSVYSMGGKGNMSLAYDGPAPYRKSLRSTHADRDAAWAEIAQRVVFADWRRTPSAMTDADYREMMDELKLTESGEA